MLGEQGGACGTLCRMPMTDTCVLGVGIVQYMLCVLYIYIYICMCVIWYSVGYFHMWCGVRLIRCVYGVCSMYRGLDVAYFLCVYVCYVLGEVHVSWCR